MLGQLAAQLGGGWQVLVLADRGAYSPRLFRCLVRLGWHPFLRVRAQGFFRPQGSYRWRDLAHLRLTKGQPQAWRARVFKNDAGILEGTLLASHDDGYEEPWLLVTDLSPAVARASWYGLRGWIEQGFKRLKGEGWKLPRTRLSSCARLERLWLAVAVATLWVLEVGGEAEAAAEAQQPAPAKGQRVPEARPALPDLDAGTRGRATKPTGPATAPPPRIWAVFARGWCLLRDALAVGMVLLGSWHPEAWPEQPSAGLPETPSASAEEGADAGHATPQGTETRSASTGHTMDSS
jgi:hypothetical protein